MCLKAVSKWIGCHIAFSSLDIMAIIDPLKKLSYLSNYSVVGWLCLVFSLPRMSGWECQTSDDYYPSLSFLQTSWPVATEVNAGCISLPVCFQLMKSGFPDISWVTCSVLQQDYTCAAVKCEIRAEQDLPWETQAINCKTFKWRARRKRLALG